MGRFLGQHFLIDTVILDRIVQTIAEYYQKTQSLSMIEIGPWQGALTKLVHEISKSFHCFEKDTKMTHHLHAFLAKDEIVRWDILESDYLVKEKEMVVGNLPYYITSPILRKFFTDKENQPTAWVFLIQKEVADKLASDAQKKSFLRRLINNFYHIEYCFTVPPEAFDPPPKVQSAVISLYPKEEPEIDDIERLEKTLGLIAPYSRKTLGRIAKINQKQWVELIIPEEIKGKRLEACKRDEVKILLSLNS